MQKIAGIIFGQEHSGAARAFYEAESLIREGHKAIVLCYNDTEQLKAESDRGYRIIKLPLNKLVQNKLFAIKNLIPLFDHIWKQKIINLIEENDINVLFIHDIFMMKAALLANKKYRLPIVLNLHENYPAAIKTYTWANKFPGNWLVQPQKWEALEGHLLNKADKIISVTEQLKNLLLNKYSFLKEDKFIVFPNVPDIKKLLSYPVKINFINRTKDDFILFYFGIIGKRRGINTCFEAIRKLKNSIPGIKLLLAGPVDKADKTDFFEQLNSNDIRNNIIYKEWVELNELPSCMSACDVGISPLVKNNQHDNIIAHKIFQYMLFGKPILVSDCIPQQKIAEEENCGLVFQSENSADMCKQILLLYENPDMRTMMGQNGRKTVLDKYNIDKYCSKITDMLKAFDK